MSKKEFINILKTRLSALNIQEIQKTISFYNEIIDDKLEEGIPEPEAVESVGSIDNIVEEIFLDQPLNTIIKNTIQKKQEDVNKRTLWILSIILSFPIWGPLFVVLTIISFLILFSWAFVITLIAIINICFWLIGFISIIYGTILCFTCYIETGLALICVSLISIGIAILTIIPTALFMKKSLLIFKSILTKTKVILIKKGKAI